MIIMDLVHILFQRGITIPNKLFKFTVAKKDFQFVESSYDAYTVITLRKGGEFCKEILEFGANDKDNINEETVELLEPYLTLMLPGDDKNPAIPLFDRDATVAGKVNGALAGLS